MSRMKGQYSIPRIQARSHLRSSASKSNPWNRVANAKKDSTHLNDQKVWPTLTGNGKAQVKAKVIVDASGQKKKASPRTPSNNSTISGNTQNSSTSPQPSLTSSVTTVSSIIASKDMVPAAAIRDSENIMDSLNESSDTQGQTRSTTRTPDMVIHIHAENARRNSISSSVSLSNTPTNMRSMNATVVGKEEMEENKMDASTPSTAHGASPTAESKVKASRKRRKRKKKKKKHVKTESNSVSIGSKDEIKEDGIEADTNTTTTSSVYSGTSVELNQTNTNTNTNTFGQSHENKMSNGTQNGAPKISEEKSDVDSMEPKLQYNLQIQPSMPVALPVTPIHLNLNLIQAFPAPASASTATPNSGASPVQVQGTLASQASHPTIRPNINSSAQSVTPVSARRVTHQGVQTQTLNPTAASALATPVSATLPSAVVGNVNISNPNSSVSSNTVHSIGNNLPTPNLPTGNINALNSLRTNPSNPSVNAQSVPSTLANMNLPPLPNHSGTPYGMSSVPVMMPLSQTYRIFSQINGTENKSIPIGPYYCLKVCAVATGKRHDQRAIAHIALIDYNLRPVVNIYIKPEQKIVSYLSPLTSLRREEIEQYGIPLAKGIEITKKSLPKNAVLIGQNIDTDCTWLGLKKSVDYRDSVDLRTLWHTWNSQFNNFKHYSLSHQSKCILNMSLHIHSAANDGITSMKLFQVYLTMCQQYPYFLDSYFNRLQSIKAEEAFSKKNPEYEGVCMGRANFCKCGAPEPTSHNSVPYIAKQSLMQ